MFSIFAHTEQTKFWLDSCRVPDLQYVVEFETWLESPRPRVALIELQQFDQDCHRLLSRCVREADHVMIFIPEFISDLYCQEFDLPNVTFFLCGRLNWQPRHAGIEDCMYFFWSTCDFYQQFPHLLEGLEGRKHLDFDVLLGRPKPHRDWIYNEIDRFSNKVTYFPDDRSRDIRAFGPEQFEWPSEVLEKPAQEINYTVQEVQVNGVIVSLSQIVPTTIYKQTKYSLVAETQNENAFSFFTEKITKPILAKRLFLVASGQYYLKNLRDLGFRTFDGIIDESYDREACARVRMDMLLKEVHRLQHADHAVISLAIEPILQHNRDHMMSTDWQRQMIDRVQQLITRI